MKTFSILGAGWLGFALANELKKDFLVKVSIKDEKKEKELINEGLSPYLLNEENYNNLEELLDTDYLFINFPPSKFKNYLSFLERIYEFVAKSKINKVFFISSTSIYPNESLLLKEDLQINNPISKKVFDAERLVEEKTDVIFRCSGLIGYNRIAGQYFSGKVVDSGNARVNYVYRDDIIKATLFTLRNDLCGIFNLCAPSHPTKKEVYLRNAKKYGFEEPIFENKKECKKRIVDGSKIERLGFRYDYPNPLEF
ncbi:GDP-L-fucose synthase [Arcobacter sp. LA11]|uniref:GDP-L-fucose synthase n=1 Tax=Arcobacter sp. LA11 TaxID=1898176 RepID=UPI00093555E4|nr:GDP-L-fucose synthase [Arcobacter sp. LA11]